MNFLFIPKHQRPRRWSLGMDKEFHPTIYESCDYVYMLGLNLIIVSKRGLRFLYSVTGMFVLFGIATFFMHRNFSISFSITFFDFTFN